jgi:hypothetical protein
VKVWRYYLIDITKIAYICTYLTMFSTRMAQEYPLLHPFRGIHVVTLSALSYHPICHVTIPSSHILKEKPLSVRVEIREQSLLVTGRVKLVAKLCLNLSYRNCVSILRSGRWGQGIPCCNYNVSFSMRMSRWGFLLSINLFSVWVRSFPICVTLWQYNGATVRSGFVS